MTKEALTLNPEFLIFLLEGGRAFVNAKELLEDLSAQDATRVYEAYSHSIAGIVAHLAYWQDWFYAGAIGDLQAYPETNDVSFSKIEASEWPTLRASFLMRLETIKALCHDAELLARPFSEGKEVAAGHDARTVGMNLLYQVALHNGHHFGQIITLRQLLKLWPPKAGGVVW